jgi:peptide-methionine (S)-S-oxide reductase
MTSTRAFVGIAALLLALVVWSARPTEAVPALPDATVDDKPGKGSATVVLAGGCFWGIEEVFQHVRGVTDVVSGYSGGSKRDAEYEAVSSGTTGHAESVKVTYDTAQVTLGTLLKVFFSVAHDPTQLNRQGPDVGPQYRSVIFYSGERQQQIARAYIDQLTADKVYRSRIVTQIVPLTAFYPAESYHQDFARKNPSHVYIVMWDKPKVENLHRGFPRLFIEHAGR